uniref:Uncharacterized protein n=1 Tax=Ciona intestinalis TaxID=7719 RepID=H2XMH2_CIOIN
ELTRRTVLPAKQTRVALEPAQFTGQCTVLYKRRVDAPRLCHFNDSCQKHRRPINLSESVVRFSESGQDGESSKVSTAPRRRMNLYTIQNRKAT